MKTFQFKHTEQDFRTAEAFKSLRSNIAFCGDDIKTVAFTSCLPGDGKSTISRNVAITFAEAEKRVLYIDADMRKSVTMRNVKVEGEVLGLSELLLGQASLGDVVYQSNIRSLNAIFAGSYPSNPAELLGSKRFSALISTLRRSFDYVIIDTPPLGSVIDSAVISSNCDGVILVIRSGAVNQKFAKRVRAQLNRSNCRILGAVLNDVNGDGTNDYYYGKKYSKYSNYY